MKTIYYELYHVQGKDTEDTEEIVRFLGLFSSAKRAKEAIVFLCIHPEFSNFPKKCFVWEKVKIDQYWWKEGFITVKEIMECQKEKNL
jgi:hypothetical protein